MPPPRLFFQEDARVDTLKKIQKVTDILLYAAIVIYFVLMFGFTNGNVFTRYLLNKPIVISNEIARYSYVAIIFLGAIFTMRADKHLSLDFFVSRLPRAGYFWITMFGRALTCVFLGIVISYGYKMVINGLITPSTAMRVPMAYFYLPVLIGAIGMLVEEIVLIIVRYRQFREGTLPSDLEDAEKKEGAEQ